jgi:hypothetical protein
MNILEKIDVYLNEAKVTTRSYIDLVNVRDAQDIPDSFKPNVPSKKTVKENDDVMLAESDRWGLVEKTDAKKVKVNLNPGMGNKPNIVNVNYDQIVAWKYDGSYSYVNKNRIIK